MRTAGSPSPSGPRPRGSRRPREGAPDAPGLPDLSAGATSIELPPSLARRLEVAAGTNALGLPLVGPEGAIGGVVLVGEDRQLFFTGEIATCETLASQLAIALANAQLQADLQQRLGGRPRGPG